MLRAWGAGQKRREVIRQAVHRFEGCLEISDEEADERRYFAEMGLAWVARLWR